VPKKKARILPNIGKGKNAKSLKKQEKPWENQDAYLSGEEGRTERRGAVKHTSGSLRKGGSKDKMYFRLNQLQRDFLDS